MLKRAVHAFTLFLFCVLAFAGGAAAPACAQTLDYRVSMNTASLATSASGPFALDFQFNDGGTPGNNTALLTNFSFGGGSVANAPSSLTGGATGSAASTIAITDTAFLNELVQTFTPGQTLAFSLRLTTNLNATPGSAPDEFSFALLDGSGNNIATTAANSDFVTVDIDSASSPTVTTAGTPTGAIPFLAAPTAALTVVPEANGSFALLVGVACLLAGVVRPGRVRLRA